MNDAKVLKRTGLESLVGLLCLFPVESFGGCLDFFWTGESVNMVWLWRVVV